MSALGGVQGGECLIAHMSSELMPIVGKKRFQKGVRNVRQHIKHKHVLQLNLCIFVFFSISFYERVARAARWMQLRATRLNSSI